MDVVSSVSSTDVVVTVSGNTDDVAVVVVIDGFRTAMIRRKLSCFNKCCIKYPSSVGVMCRCHGNRPDRDLRDVAVLFMDIVDVSSSTISPFSALLW